MLETYDFRAAEFHPGVNAGVAVGIEQDDITYEELADLKWRGKICMRSGQRAYNSALIASMMGGLAGCPDLAER